jgi:hypothetical protein
MVGSHILPALDESGCSVFINGLKNKFDSGCSLFINGLKKKVHYMQVKIITHLLLND